MDQIKETTISKPFQMEWKGMFSSLTFVVLLYRILLDTSYVFFVSNCFRGNRFDLMPDALQIIESYVFLFIIYILLPKKQDQISNVVLQMFFLMAYVPVGTYFALGEGGRPWFYTIQFFFVFLFLFHKLIPSFTLSWPKTWKISKWNIFLVALLLPLAVVAILLNYPSLEFNLSFSNVEIYKVREIYSSIQNQVPLGGYFFNWTGRVVLPFLILASLFANKKTSYVLLIVSSVLIVFLFAVSGHKSFVFRPLLALGVAVLLPRMKFLKEFTLLLMGLICISLIIYVVADEVLPASLVVRRVLLLPSQVSWFYYDFFDENYLHLSHSIFKGIMEYPYDVPHENLIYKVYEGQSDVHANNGILSDGFKNFGLAGMFIWSIVLAGLLKVSDAVSSKKNMMVVGASIVVSFYTMINGEMLTTLFTHGLLIALLLSYFYPVEKK